MQTWTSKINPPLAAPWNARAIISVSIVFAVAQTADEAKNHANASNTINFRPQMSDNLAQMTPDAAFASKKAAPIQV
jgi:hypothetical protein